MTQNAIGTFLNKPYIKKLGMLPVLFCICLIFFALTSNFGSFNNLRNIFRAASINIVLASGMTIVILTGGIDLSVGSLLAVTSVIALQVSLLFSYLAIPVALLVGTAIGLLHAVLISYVKLPPFIVTLGGLTAWRGAAYLFANGTTVINNNITYAWIGNNEFLFIPWLGWIACIVIVLCWFILQKTVLGVRIYAVGGNEQAARFSGINVSSILLFAYGFMGLLSGLAGIMISSRLYSANGLMGQSFELDAIAAVILGGTSFVGGIGGIGGTLIGAFIIAVLNNGLTLLQVSFYWQLVMKGIVIILAVTLDKMRNSAKG